MNRQHLVVIGNGMAGMRTVEHLLRLAPERYTITVIGREPRGNYNRILLSPVLAGEKTFDDTLLHDLPWYAEQGIRLIAGASVTAIDHERRCVQTDQGQLIGYDRLVLATGSEPFMPPLPGIELEGVLGFRDLDDVEAMLEAARQYRHAVVIGGGILGLEAADALTRRGMQVTVVHRNGWLMDRQLDATAGRMLQTALEARGIRFVLEASTEAMVGQVRVQGMRLRVPSLPAGEGGASACDGFLHDPRRLGGGHRRGASAHRAGPGGRPRLWARGDCGRPALHLRPGHLRGRRVHRAPRRDLRPGGPRVGAGRGVGAHPRRG